MLRLEENKFWISLADSDVLLWAQGVAVHSGLDVCICEPDVSPLQLQGPRAMDIMKALFGEDISQLKYYWLRHYDLNGIPIVVSEQAGPASWVMKFICVMAAEERNCGKRSWRQASPLV